MDFNQIMELTKWLEKSAFTAYTLSVGAVHLSVNKTNYPAMPSWHSYTMPQTPIVATGNLMESAPAAAPVMPQATSVSEQAAPSPKAESVGHIIKSPIVGTFYESTNPQSPAFVQVGQKVKKGDVLCILEAMKIMNEICADTDGVVAEIFVKNGQMVEAKQNLFRIEA